MKPSLKPGNVETLAEPSDITNDDAGIRPPSASAQPSLDQIISSCYTPQDRGEGNLGHCTDSWNENSDIPLFLAEYDLALSPQRTAILPEARGECKSNTGNEEMETCSPLPNKETTVVKASSPSTQDRNDRTSEHSQETLRNDGAARESPSSETHAEKSIPELTANMRAVLNSIARENTGAKKCKQKVDEGKEKDDPSSRPLPDTFREPGTGLYETSYARRKPFINGYGNLSNYRGHIWKYKPKNLDRSRPFRSWEGHFVNPSRHWVPRRRLQRGPFQRR